MTTSPSVDRVAVVTGGARGIGLASAEWFLRNGYRVALLDNDSATLAQTDATLNQPDRVLAVPCDVSQPAQVQAAVQAILARFGRVDALVNNAGVAVFKPIAQTTFEEWRYVMATNLDGAFLCTQAFAPEMLKTGGGSVVNIASISGLRASTLRVAYGTSKAAIIHLTKQQAVEYGNAGVRVNAIRPARSRPRWPNKCTTRPFAPTTLTPSRSSATAARKKSPRPLAFCAARPAATSTARCWPWTAALMPQAWACPPCDATHNATVESQGTAAITTRPTSNASR